MEMIYDKRQENDLTIEEIAKRLNVNKGTIGIYLVRDQFNYVLKIKDSYRVYYRNVTSKTFKQLKALIYRKRGGYTS